MHGRCHAEPTGSLQKQELQQGHPTARELDSNGSHMGPFPFPAKKQKFLLSMIHLSYHHQIANMFTYMSLL